MKKYLVFLFSMISALVFADEASPRLARMEFKSVPEGAQVFINGESRGMTPFSLGDLKPGKTYHLRMELDDYDPYDAVFTAKEGANETKFAKLEPLKGILLVTSDPAGAEISLDGYSLGETPRLITTLETKGRYALVLKKTGYLDTKIEVGFEGRRPLVHHVKLVLNSGVANITSEPSGADVVLNGISRGTTPVTVSEIPKGQLVLVLKKEGYKTLTREISINAGDTPNLYYELEALPGQMNLTSLPGGARFYINGEPRGEGPLYLKNVKPGTYTVKVEKDGYDAETREITVANGETVNEEFRLSSNLAKLEIRTRPAGVAVEIDGRRYGSTKGSSDPNRWSDVLIIPGLKACEHTVRLKRRGYAEVVEHPVLKVSSTTPLNIPMRAVFTPNIRIKTATETIEGVMKASTGTYITLEVKPGVERTIQQENIRDQEYLDGRE